MVARNRNVLFHFTFVILHLLQLQGGISKLTYKDSFYNNSPSKTKTNDVSKTTTIIHGLPSEFEDNENHKKRSRIISPTEISERISKSLCVRLPDGSWDCDKTNAGRFENDYLETFDSLYHGHTLSPIYSSQPPTIVPTDSMSAPVLTPMRTFSPTLISTSNPSERNSDLPNTIPKPNIDGTSILLYTTESSFTSESIPDHTLTISSSPTEANPSMVIPGVTDFTLTPTFSPSPSSSFLPTPKSILSTKNKNLKLCQFTHDPTYSCSNNITSTMKMNERRISSGQYLCSNNGRYLFGMTLDYHLTICKVLPNYDNVKSNSSTSTMMDTEMIMDQKNMIRQEMVWSLGPFQDRNPSIVFKKNGSLEVHNRKQTTATDFYIMWSSGTTVIPQPTLILDDDGIVKILNENNAIIWTIDPNSMDDSENDLLLDWRVHSNSITATSDRIEPEPGLLSSSLSPSISKAPSVSPSISKSPIGSETYFPGKLFHDRTTGLKLSVGLQARLIAKSGLNVSYSNGTQSSILFHDQPDAGGCFPIQNNNGDEDGWYYLSNSELGNGNTTDGGVGRITFDSNGDVKEYKMVLTNTRMNCGSGKTPWGTYISCEEYKGIFGNEHKKPGQCWEIHPSEEWMARPTQMGGIKGGRFESAAFDARQWMELKGFVTTDHKKGALYRYTPNATALAMALSTGNYSEVLHTSGGTIDYLVMDPMTNTFHWNETRATAEASAKANYPNSEGIDVHDGYLYFTSKKNKELYILNLDTFKYTRSSTTSGAFNGQPDQIVRLLPRNPNNTQTNDNNNDNEEEEEGLLYFLEDGGRRSAGVFGRDRSAGKYITILEGGKDHSDETTGLAFCDHGRRMMIAFQDEGTLYEITREDGKPFHGATVDIKYHGE